MTATEIDWSFRGTWPFAPRYFQSADGVLHYVDEGAASRRATILVHGDPAWGYLYRRFIAAFVDAGLRSIAPDLLGFGRSEKPSDPSLYTLERHCERFELWVDSLGLEEVNLVVHDWGGIVALPWAAKHPEAVSRLCVLNTFAPAFPSPFGLVAETKGLRARGETLIGRHNVVVEQFLLGAGLAHPERLDECARAAYRAPLRDSADRSGTLAFTRAMPFSAEDSAAQIATYIGEALKSALARTPLLLVWGLADPFFGVDTLRSWTDARRDAEVVTLADAGHFLQEDAPDAVIAAVLGFIQDSPRTPRGQDTSP